MNILHTLEIDLGKKKAIINIRHMKKDDVEGIWNNFNEVVEEGNFLPVFIPVRSQLEKNSWYQNVKSDKEIVIVADNPNLKSPYNILGQCEISNIEWDAADHVGNLGIIIQKKYRNKGIGSALINYAIKESKKLNNKQKIILSCFASNERALYLYKKLGFKKVGVRKKQFFIDDTYHDEVLMDLWIEDYLEEQG
ncbi:MAG: N-acetyltransferase [Promethearchaeota archaeon]|nr:MAG: N-acetyltransferase [Candidatus Lokiarchaeota archaeon]